MFVLRNLLNVKLVGGSLIWDCKEFKLEKSLSPQVLCWGKSGIAGPEATGGNGLLKEIENTYVTEGFLGSEEASGGHGEVERCGGLLKTLFRHVVSRCSREGL